MMVLCDATGELIDSGMDMVKSGFSYLAKKFDETKKQFEEKDKPQDLDGHTVNIVTSGPFAENNQFLPGAKDPSKTRMVDKDVIDGMGSIAPGGVPGSRGNPKTNNPGGNPPPTASAGEVASGVSETATGAYEPVKNIKSAIHYGDTIRLTPDGRPDVPYKHVGFNPISDTTATVYYAF